jgi:hypothetical protein
MSTASDERPAPAPLGEALPLAQAMHADLARLVADYRRVMGLPVQEALAQLGQPNAQGAERVLKVPPGSVGWADLALLDRNSPRRDWAARRTPGPHRSPGESG